MERRGGHGPWIRTHWQLIDAGRGSISFPKGEARGGLIIYQWRSIQAAETVFDGPLKEREQAR